MTKDLNTWPALDLNAWDAVLRGHKGGADAVEIYAARSQSFRVRLQDGEIDDFSLSQTGGVCLRADCGQIGYAYSEHPDQDPNALLARAVENAANVENEDAPFMRFYEGAPHYETLPPVDDRLIASSADDKIALARSLERATLAQDPAIVRLESCAVSTSLSRSAIRNSLGLSVAQQHGFAIAYCSPIAERNGEVKNGFAYDIARCPEALDLDRIARESAEDALAQFGAQSVPSGRYDVVLKSDALIDLLSAFLSLFSAEAAQKGFSLLAHREGESIASPAVTLVDDPRHPASLFHAAFDAEGVPTERHTIVEAGRFETFLHNRKTARKAGTQTTGHAAKGSVASPIGVAPHGFLLTPGNASRDSLFHQMQNGLYITDLSGLHAGVNAVAGSFSLLARGFTVERGVLARPVEQIALAGSFLDLLQQLVAPGNDLRFGLQNVAAPSALVEGLQVAGK